MKRTTYVTHCRKCCRTIEKDKREGPCPPVKTGPINYISPTYNSNPFGYTEYGGPKDGRVPYFDENLDEMVYSKSHKQELLKKYGLRQVDSGIRRSDVKRDDRKRTLYFFPK